MEAVKKKILVVEDDKYVINLISNALSTLSLDYFLACNGKDALEILERYPDQVSLIILDWIMPLMGGIEFANIIRNDKRFKDIPIIMQTSKKDQSDLKQAYDIDIQHYLIKPYTAKVLLSAVKQSLREIRKKDYIVMEAKSMVDSVISYTKSKLLSTLKKVDLDLKSYREINRFYLESLSCTNLEELTELILSCVTAFEFESSIDAGYDDLGKKLRCSIKLSSQEVVNLSDRGIKSSLDEMILSKTLDKGEVLEQSTYTAIPSNNKKVAILIRNTPGDEKEKK
ncbi:MAG: response regulator, partial [Deltaproteobacteria bacterium]|nr:response regulator [Deltaproteobacteria bacterium]